MAVSDFFRRHRRKVLYAVGASAGAYMLVQYVKNKFVELQERFLFERMAKETMERRFEQNQKDAAFTIMALLPTLSLPVMEQYDVEATKSELQALRAPAASETEPSQSLQDSQTGSLQSSLQGSQELSASADLAASTGTAPKATGLDGSYVTPSKSQLWTQMKIQSLTRAFTLVYGIALLTVLTRIQLNILGRRSYMATLQEAALEGQDRDKQALDQSELVDLVNRQYLTFSWWLLNKGRDALSKRVEAAVELVTADLDPRAPLTLEQLNDLVARIQYSVDSPEPVLDFDASPLVPRPSSFLAALLPPPELETYVLNQAPGSVLPPDTVEGDLRDLLNETADLIESPNAAELIHRLVSVGLGCFIDKLAPLYKEPGSTAKLASIMAGATRQAHQMAAGHPLSNPYVNAMSNVPELDAFCAVIYSNF